MAPDVVDPDLVARRPVVPGSRSLHRASCSGDLHLVARGPVVPWSLSNILWQAPNLVAHGLVVLWSRGPVVPCMVPCSCGPVVPRSRGPVVPWSRGPESSSKKTLIGVFCHGVILKRKVALFLIFCILLSLSLYLYLFPSVCLSLSQEIKSEAEQNK